LTLFEGTDKVREMNVTNTGRGFQIAHFTDGAGKKCSMQISSAIHEETLLWLGFDEIGLVGFNPDYTGWHEIPEKELAEKLGFQDILTNTRMHLTQTQVKNLLPFLQKFAETGELK